MPPLYSLARDLHFAISRFGFGAALAMLAIAIYIGLIRHGDVTPHFRRATYVIAGMMGVEALAGLALYLSGGRPAEEVHLIYGVGAALSLPFFIFVETTAKKRPAMGSYIWGFALLAAILIRAIMTGARG